MAYDVLQETGMMEQKDPYRLDRFLDAQAEDYECAISALLFGCEFWRVGLPAFTVISNY